MEYARRGLNQESELKREEYRDLIEQYRHRITSEILDYKINVPESIKVRLGYAGRRLEITFDLNSRSIGGYYDKRPNSVNTPGSTALLFRDSLLLMKSVVQKEGVPYTYTFTTDINTMAEWALSEGEQIFKWENVNDTRRFSRNTKEKSGMLYAYRTINPR